MTLKRPSFTQEEVLAFHSQGKPGKIEINPTKPMATQRDLSLAYSPGVAVPVRVIAERPDAVYDYTAKGNLVAVISNGTAILGLGDLGALASKPVMEGKAVLFKRFADVDAIDIEVDTRDVDQFINCVRYLGPTFGGINLEDIKAPDCFVIEERLRELMGAFAMVFTISGVTASFTERPRNTSQPLRASSSERSLVCTAWADFHWFMPSVRPQ